MGNRGKMKKIDELYYQIQRANHETPADVKYEFAKACFKEAIREVMEWVEKNKGEEDYTDSNYQRRTNILLDKEALQAFLKEKGIKEVK